MGPICPLGTFCPLGRFVHWDVLSLGRCPWDVVSLGTFCPLGRFVPWDVLFWEVLYVHRKYPAPNQRTKIKDKCEDRPVKAHAPALVWPHCSFVAGRINFENNNSFAIFVKDSIFWPLWYDIVITVIWSVGKPAEVGIFSVESEPTKNPIFGYYMYNIAIFQATAGAWAG